MTKQYTLEIASIEKSGPVRSTAPNGSSTGTDYYTTVKSVQTWLPGTSYAGYRYTITQRYISNHPDRQGQLISSSSTFLSGPR